MSPQPEKAEPSLDDLLKRLKSLQKRSEQMQKEAAALEELVRQRLGEHPPADPPGTRRKH